jgi:hypothetical protein
MMYHTSTSIISSPRAQIWSADSVARCNIFVGAGDLGLGVFAKRRIAIGEKIMTFRGPVVDFATAVAKGEWQCYPLQVSPSRYIDLTEPSCFANHSCSPNAGLRRLSLYALSDIPRGHEIRYDYSTTMDEDYWTMACLCRSATCRGIVTDFKYLEERIKRYYLERGLVQPFIARQYLRSSVAA